MGKQWLAIAVVLLAGCKEHASTAQAGEAISGKAAPVVSGPALATPDIPTSPPLIGEAGKRPDGYPWQRPDKVKLLSLLRMRRFAALDRFFNFYQDAFEQDYHYEEWPDQATFAFDAADPELGAPLDEWVTYSGSFAAHLARGQYRQRLGWHYRGHAYASKTTDKQFHALDAYFASARDDVERAIALRPKLVAGYRRLIQIENASSKNRDVGIGELLGRAIAQCELCYTPRASAINALLPRWHGSYELMRELASRTSVLYGQNPRLRLLSGAEDIDRCDVLQEQKRYKEAVKPCALALEHGEDIAAYLANAELYDALGDPTRALSMLDRALRVDGQALDALKARARLRLKKEDLAGAAKDALLARLLDPTNEWITKFVEHLVAKLRYAGSELNKAGKKQEASELFSLGLQLAPDDRDLMYRMGFAERATDLTDPSIEQQLAAAPDDFQLRLRIDSGLAASHRFKEVVAMWDAYILAHLRDPRAYTERAGAHWHLREIDQALGDMQHACALGLEKACTDVQRMKAIAGR